MNHPSSQKGFSLLEVLLAVTIAISLGSMQLGKIKRETESAQATSVGEQLKMVGGALNSYVALHYNNITAMTNVTAPGTADDPGPRTCDTATGICTITSDTLRRNGLLPNSFSGRNAYGATYQYYIRVAGVAPNWQVDGIVVTSDPYTVGAIPRFDLIGQAMVTAGSDSGTTRTLGNQLDGLNGAWMENTYPINQVGLLGYRVGYGTSGLVHYLRIDGANFMTGDLKLGDPTNSTTNRNISSVRNISATGDIQSSKINLTSPTADAISTTAGTIGASGANMIIRTGGGLQVMNAAGTVGAPLQAGNANLGNVTSSGTGVFNGALESASLNTTTGSITSASDITANNNIVAVGNISTTNGNIVTTNGDISAGGNISSASLNVANTAITTNNWDMGTGANATGWYRTSDTDAWLRVKNDKGIYTGGEIRSGTMVRSLGTVMAEGFVQVGGTQVLGSGCSNPTTTGGSATTSIARDAAGRLLQCVAGTWQSAGSLSNSQTVVSGWCNNGTSCYATCPAGTKLSGGGYAATRVTATDATAPMRSYANTSTNQWIVESVAASTTSSFQAQAVCVN